MNGISSPLIILWYMCINFHIQAEEIYNRVAFEQTDHQNTAVLNGIFLDLRDETHITCIRECARKAVCMSFSYNYHLRGCRLHNSMTYNATATEIGWQNYFMKGCPLGWFQFENACYLFEDVKMEAWGNAQKQCQSLNAKLVDIDTYAEQTFLVSIATTLKESSMSVTSFYGFWNGGTDASDEGTWRWNGTGNVFTYTSWYPGEPDSWIGDEDCNVMDGDVNYEWRDVNCFFLRNYICEREIA